MRLVTPPASAPVTLNQAKAWLKVEGIEEDALILGLIDTATAFLDGPKGRLRKALEPQTWELSLDAFPAGAIRLPLGPVTEVDAVRYRDRQGIERTLDPARYAVTLGSAEGQVSAIGGWPDADASRPGAITVLWQAGEGCPEPIRHAILMLVAYWHRNREAVTDVSNARTAAAVPFGVEAAIALHKVYS